MAPRMVLLIDGPLAAAGHPAPGRAHPAAATAASGGAPTVAQIIRQLSVRPAAVPLVHRQPAPAEVAPATARASRRAAAAPIAARWPDLPASPGPAAGSVPHR